jgi:cardiolipin synthase C
MGIVIDSPTLAGLVADAFGDVVPDNAYEVALSDRRGLVWKRPDLSTPLRREPGMGLRDRLAIGILKRLRIEWLL